VQREYHGEEERAAIAKKDAVEAGRSCRSSETWNAVVFEAQLTAPLHSYPLRLATSDTQATQACASPAAHPLHRVLHTAVFNEDKILLLEALPRICLVTLVDSWSNCTRKTTPALSYQNNIPTKRSHAKQTHTHLMTQNHPGLLNAKACHAP
jgi:hypothetical protein